MDYFKINAVNSTLLKEISLKSIAHALTEKPKTPAMILGSAMHSYILEPEKFIDEFCVLPKYDKRTKDGKEKYNIFLSELNGREIISEDDFLMIKSMKETLMSSSLIDAILSDGKSEEIYLTKLHGLDCKIKVDYSCEKYLVDYKTTLNAEPSSFHRQIINMGYHIQAAFYLDVYNKATNSNVNEFYFIAQEKTQPFACSVNKMSQELINAGRDRYLDAMEIYNRYLENKTISPIGYDEQIYTVLSTDWA